MPKSVKNLRLREVLLEMRMKDINTGFKNLDQCLVNIRAKELRRKKQQRYRKKSGESQEEGVEAKTHKKKAPKYEAESESEGPKKIWEMTKGYLSSVMSGE